MDPLANLWNAIVTIAYRPLEVILSSLFKLRIQDYINQHKGKHLDTARLNWCPFCVYELSILQAQPLGNDEVD